MSMLSYTLRRLLSMIPLLILVSVVVFALAKLMPGDPFGGEIDPNNTNVEYIEEMREKNGYKQPVSVRYLRWVTDVVHGDIGKSTTFRRPVLDRIIERWPNTIFLAVTALMITLLLSVILAVYAGRNPC